MDAGWSTSAEISINLFKPIKTGTNQMYTYYEFH